MFKENVILNIIDKFGTPAYIYDFSIIDNKVNLLKEIIGDTNNLYYSVKANPNVDILKHLKQHNLGVEVSSVGELKLVQKIGYENKKIIFSGPGKSESDLKYVINSNIRCINVESIEEIKRIQNINSETNIKTSIALRINPDKNAAGTGIKMTGISSQFGIEWKNIFDVIYFCLECSGINLIGIQLYNGTQLLNPTDILNNINQTIKYVREIQNKFDISIRYIDFGGGFGINYFLGENPLDAQTLKENLSIILKENLCLFNNAYCIFESGRFLVSEAGIYVTTIIEKKINKDNKFLICDGGSNHHANSAFLGRMIRGNYPIKVINKKGRNADKYELVNITGPLCTPFDIIGRNIQIKECDADDLVVVEKSGAYSLSNSPLMFILHPLPKEIIINGNDIFLSTSMHQIFELLIGDVTNANFK